MPFPVYHDNDTVDYGDDDIAWGRDMEDDEDLEETEEERHPYTEPTLDDMPAVHDKCGTDCAEDVDCITCGLKFWVAGCLKPLPKECPRCEKGLPPLYEY